MTLEAIARETLLALVTGLRDEPTDAGTGDPPLDARIGEYLFDVENATTAGAALAAWVKTDGRRRFYPPALPKWVRAVRLAHGPSGISLRLVSQYDIQTNTFQTRATVLVAHSKVE